MGRITGLSMTMRMKALGAWSKLWESAPPRFMLDAGQTKLRIVNRDWATRGLVSWTPSWKSTLIGKVLKERPGTFLDVGANIGQTLVDWMSAPNRSTYVGFEPNVTCVRHLNSIIAGNKIEAAKIIPVGLSNESGVLTLYMQDDADSAATMVEDLRPGRDLKMQPVPVYRLDDIRDTIPNGPISLIKIDVEGGELHALQGMTSLLAAQSPWIMCEVLHRDPKASEPSYRKHITDLYELLNSIDYEVLRIVQTGDGGAVKDLEGTNAFPDLPYTAESRTRCDYLFLPKGQGQAARKSIL